MNNKGVFIIVGSAVALWLWKSAKSIQNDVTFYPKDVGIGGTLFAPQLIITMVAHNVGSDTSKITYVNCKVSYNDNEIGTINVNSPFVVLPESDTLFRLPVNISSVGLALEVISLLKSGGANGVLNISGTIGLDGFNIPVTTEYHI